MSEDGKRSPAEFVSEAQDLIETLSSNLLELERQQRDGNYDPDVLNGAFRAVHSLKGLSGMFGSDQIGAVSHVLENTLDSLRLGKLPMDQAALDALFEAVDVFSGLLALTVDEGAPSVDTASLFEHLDRLGKKPDEGAGGVDLGWLDDSILGVLTEYEEHRLKENLRSGKLLFRVHAAFDLLKIDTGIEALKEKLKAFGEVITYLPSADSSSDDLIELDILVGSQSALADLTAGVADAGITVHQLSPAASAPEPAPAPEPSPAAPAPARRAVRATVTPDPDADFGDFDEKGEGEVSVRSLSQTVRVDLDRLDHLMNLVGELGLVQTNLGEVFDRLRTREAGSDLARDLQLQVRSMTRKLDLLQQGILEVRMVPLGQVFDKLARVVRKLGRDAGKDVRLSISGADTELDKLIVEELSDPLVHIIRNAIDHGIEPPDDRASTGKPPTGTVQLRAFQKGNRVVIEVEDDGRGMDWKRIRDTAVEREFISKSEAADLSADDALGLIFTPGFSTKGEVTELSGRGVGMDVVKTNIARLSGMIDVDTREGSGTRFSITLPVTLAIIQALVIQTAAQTFCIPLNSVLESIMVSADEIATVEGQEVISLRGRTLPLLHLSQLFHLGNRGFLDPRRVYVVIVGLAQHRVGIVVDELLGQQDVVIKPLGRALRGIPGIAGATEVGAHRTVLLLDVATLVTDSLRRADLGSSREEARPIGP